MQVFHSKSRGVTLVELSIVLAILGVLIVATISGRSLIDIARATSTMQQLRDRSLAFQIFNSTYDCIPGDCVEADSRVSGVASGINGNGTGMIETYTTNGAKNEVAFVEHHLVASKLFNRTVGDVTDGIQSGQQNNLRDILPESKAPNGYISSLSEPGQHFHLIGGFTTNNSTTSDIINHVAVPSGVFKVIDSKMDDGVSNTGHVRCHEGTAPTDTAPYTLPSTITEYEGSPCILSVLMDF